MFGQSPPPSQPKAGPASFDIAAPPAAPPRPTTATHRVAPAVAPFHKNIAPQTAPQPSGHPQQHPYAPVPPQQLAPPHIPSPQLSRPVIRQQSPAAMQPPRAPATMSAAYPTPAAHVADDIPTNLGSMHISEDPVLISKHVPKDGSTKWRWIIAILIILFIMLIVFDILLDADFITLRQVPHTRFF
jgi:hypothetical protein